MIKILLNEDKAVPFTNKVITHIALNREDCRKIKLLLSRDFINQNESPGREAYPILEAIMEFGGD